MNSPLISILLSAYNSQDTITSCLTSVLKQTYRPIELICINDGSTDKTFTHLKKFQKKHSDIKVIIIDNKKNLGLTKSLNLGLKTATGRFTARIDADDSWSTDKLTKQYAFLADNSDYGLVGCNYVNHYQHTSKKIYLPTTDSEIKNQIFKKNPFAHSCVVFNTKLVKSVGGYDDSVKFGQDYDLWLTLYPLTNFYNLQDFLCVRNAKSGISFTKQRPQMLQCAKTQAKYILKYQKPLFFLIYLLEPLLVALAPRFVKKLFHA